jgi:hypothetical protein
MSLVARPQPRKGLEWRVSVREARRESGEKLDTKSIGHRALAKIEFACKVKLPDARIAYRDKCWWGDSP